MKIEREFVIDLCRVLWTGDPKQLETARRKLVDMLVNDMVKKYKRNYEIQQTADM